MFNTHEYLKANERFYTSLSDSIWEVPQLCFQEVEAANYMASALDELGFRVMKNVGGLETAVMGEYGNGPTVIAFLGEYDALPGLSQKGAATKYEPVEQDGNGHGCGHNMLGTGALAAAAAIKEYIDQNEAPITVRFYGCPAEEAGSGKAHMVKAGVFDDVDLAISWHPANANAVMNMSSLANYAIKFKYYGISSHAAATPHLGRSALDAVELLNIGVNFLREHVEQDVRMHYAITNAGGTAANVVQAYAEVSYLIRAPKKKQVMDVLKRVQKIAEGAALMTETTVEMEFEGAASNLIPNTTLAKVMQQQLEEAVPLSFTDEEYAYAQKLYDTLDEPIQKANATLVPSQKWKLLDGKKLNTFVEDFYPETLLPGSTDVGDVSWVTPTAQVATCCWPLAVPAHTWQVVAVGKTSIAHKGMLYAAEVMANTAIYAIENEQIIKEAKQELLTRLNGETYVSLIPSNDE